MAPESIADTAFADIKNEYTVYYPADGVGYDDPVFQSRIFRNTNLCATI